MGWGGQAVWTLQDISSEATDVSFDDIKSGNCMSACNAQHGGCHHTRMVTNAILPPTWVHAWEQFCITHTISSPLHLDHVNAQQTKVCSERPRAAGFCEHAIARWLYEVPQALAEKLLKPLH